MGRGFCRPIFLFVVRFVRRFRGVYAETAFARASPLGSMKSDYIEISLANRLHVDLSADPFLQQDKVGWIRIDRNTARSGPIAYALRDRSTGLGVCAHTVSPWHS
ncbi:hypothetical protein AGR1C_pAt20015 [Agrobacterium fabacearum TT111]|nr:hypothetical protein AGR1C_pAt20015 [Agrobacterium fabacearum TT111]